MKMKNRVDILNIIMLFTGFGAFTVLWVIIWTLFIGLQFVNGISGRESFFNYGWSFVFSDLGYFLPVPLTSLFVYFFTKGSLKKTLLFLIVGFILLLIIFSLLGFTKSFLTHLNYVISGR